MPEKSLGIRRQILDRLRPLPAMLRDFEYQKVIIEGFAPPHSNFHYYVIREIPLPASCNLILVERSSVLHYVGQWKHVPEWLQFDIPPIRERLLTKSFMVEKPPQLTRVTNLITQSGGVYTLKEFRELQGEQYAFERNRLLSFLTGFRDVRLDPFDSNNTLQTSPFPVKNFQKR